MHAQQATKVTDMGAVWQCVHCIKFNYYDYCQSFNNVNFVPNNLADDKVNSCDGSRQTQQVLCFRYNILYIQPFIQQTIKFFHKTLRHAAS